MAPIKLLLESLANEYDDFWCRLSMFNGFSSGGFSAKLFHNVYWQHYNFFFHIRTTSWECGLRLGKTQRSQPKELKKKCAFACEEEVVLVFKVSKERINPNPAKNRESMT